ncbi:MAG TPA: Crp/Fnr family transcriptional regulator [Pseudolabrys sp.]|nr:Crp/Fnr family transcriptional regulator [Pseudolabrys sp.]
MTLTELDFGLPKLQAEAGNGLGAIDDNNATQMALSTALVSVFRGNFCDVILPNRKAVSFLKNTVIYSLGDKERTLFFLTSGFVKVGTITSNGGELIYEVRKGGEVVGELCAAERERPDRAVALEDTDAIPIPFNDIRDLLMTDPRLMTTMIDTFCAALKQAYAQINTLAGDNTINRIAKTLVGLAAKIGQRSGALVELPIYLTQEEIAQMVAARRERVSTGLNFLRRRGMVQYTNRGHLLIHVSELENLAAA